MLPVACPSPSEIPKAIGRGEAYSSYANTNF